MPEFIGLEANLIPEKCQKSPQKHLFAVGMVLSAIYVGLLGHAGIEKISLVCAVQVFVPQQGAACALFGLKRWFVNLELLNKLRGF